MPCGDWTVRFRKELAESREAMIERVVEALELDDELVAADLLTSWMLIVPSELDAAALEATLRDAGIPPLTVS